MIRALTLALLLSAFVIPAALAQASPNDPGTVMPVTDILGSTLIVWSDMQTPEPVPQPAPRPLPPTPEPLPETQTSPSTPTAPTSPSQPSQPAPSQDQGQTQQPATQTFTGTISKEGDSYVLKVSDTSSYKLDDQDKAKQYDGQRVRVLGMLDQGSNLIHVQNIEPVS